MSGAEATLLPALVRLGLVSAGAPAPVFTPLAGGVSSDIWRVALPAGPVCVKRALARLKVAADWKAPVERNAFEYAWFALVGEQFPHVVPELLGRDADAGLFVMRFLEPVAHPVWKAELAAARVDPAFGAAVGRSIAAIHAMTANRADIAARFATDAAFHALRLEPYLLATAERHPCLADRLHAIVASTAATKLALVHGDVSPKNILCGPRGPVFLDAECAWYGDPAFDLAFCLNHLLLKCLWVPAAAPLYLATFDALADAYLRGVTWEPPERIEARTAALLPGLFLARVDGKSPVEYITEERDRNRVRRVATALIEQPPTYLSGIRDAWQEEIAA